jgi:starch synthase
LQHIHQLPRDWLVDPTWGKMMINPSRIAIICSDQWSTVSKSYRDDLLNSSPLAPLLRLKQQPFAHPNGIPIADRVKKLNAVAPTHLHAKRLIQKKYFNMVDLDDSIPLYAFVGRITTQKGVHLILDIAEDIIDKTKG